MEQNEGLRVVFVGDDDQNIYEFRGSDSKYMQQLITVRNAKKYELINNYRSKENIVSLANQWTTGLSHRLKNLPIIAADRTNGKIKIIEHHSVMLIPPVIQSIMEAHLTGSTCVLTRTNDEAVQITGFLIKKGYAAKLIQTNDGFNLHNLKELKYFTSLVTTQTGSPVISEDEWEEAKKNLAQTFQRSNKLEGCQSVIKDFETINPVKRYKSDWKTFLNESRFEDFVRINGETIYVSTIHKAKGKEFENVFLMLDRFDATKEEYKRQFYVAVTRAKTNLTIHYNGRYLENLITADLTYSKDLTVYPPTSFISCLLTHKDVKLGYFEFVQHRINGLVSGDVLLVTPEGLASGKGLVVKFSKEFTLAIERWYQKGFKLESARVNFLVYWFNAKGKKEVEIVLPELTFVS
jgi:ATP-dependent DNA helicase RecQ